LLVTASMCALASAPPERAWAYMAISCGLASARATPAPIPAAASLSQAGRRASQPPSAATAMITAMTAVSWFTRIEAPSTTPSTTACRRPWWRRSRTAASSVTGSDTAPSAMFRCVQSWNASMEESPKNAPAAMAPVRVRSQSPAAR
jgi:hypothetical protein